MHLAFIDWFIIVVYFLFSLAIGLYYRKMAGKSMTDFFLSGRNLTWFIAGISMVATTFAADTPLAVTELVARNGISGNWLWWNALFGGMLTTFFFSKLWRRAEVLTEVELIELRYSGREAALLRGFKSIYLGFFMNSLIIGWVNVALITILQIFFGISPEQSLWYAAGAMLITAIYSSISGLWGVAITDAFQFIIAMTGTIILAVIVVSSDQIGGIDGLKAQLPSSSFDFFPHIGSGGAVNMLVISASTFFAYIGIQWWASWYPGAEPGGGGYVAQRIMSAKNEKHAVYATLFFQIAHYCLRPWPWIIVGLCTLVLYPELGFDEKRLGYVMAMKDFLPVGLKGLLLVAFLAAYMSTIATQLNWGASYLVNDFYNRFINKEASQKLLVKASRISTMLLMLVALLITSRITSISDVWIFIIECGAGLGLVLILRWYWWRINAWSEIAATITPFIAYFVSKKMMLWVFPNSFFFTVGATTLTWLLVTFLTKPTATETLHKFYLKVRPEGQWGPVKKALGIGHSKSSVPYLLLSWMSAVCMTYSILFCSGKFIFKEWNDAGFWFIIALAAFFVLRFSMNRSAGVDEHNTIHKA